MTGTKGTAEVVDGVLKLTSRHGQQVAVRRTSTGVEFVAALNEKPYIDFEDLPALIDYLTPTAAAPDPTTAVAGIAPPTSSQAAVDVAIFAPKAVTDFLTTVASFAAMPGAVTVGTDGIVSATMKGNSEFDIGMEAADMENALKTAFSDNSIKVMKA